MYSPKDLDGEVDHSFFDSDCEVGSAEVGRATRESLEEEAGSSERKPSHSENHQSERRAGEGGRIEAADEQEETERDFSGDRTGATRLEEEFSELHVRNCERQDGSEDAENKAAGSHQEGERVDREEEEESRDRRDHSDARNEDKLDSVGVDQKQDGESEQEDSDASSRKSSPMPASDWSESRRGSQSDGSSSDGSSSSVEPRSEDDDESVLREEQTHPESQPPEHDIQFSINPVGNRLAGKFRTRSQGCLSSSEHESSNSSGEKSPALPPKSSPAPSSPPQPSRESRLDSETTESEDTVTDVTPLSTPDVSPKESFDLTPPNEPSATVARQQPQDVAEEAVATDEDAARRASSDSDGEERSVALSSGRRLDGGLVVSSPGSASTTNGNRRRWRRRRTNYSFTDEEVRRIERENQRLLRELSRTPPRTCGAGPAQCPALAPAGLRPPGPPNLRLYHTALNRQREQQRIQRENLAFLKRLESVKPTPGMIRSEQLADYQRQAGYLGIPTSLTRPMSGRGTRSYSTNSPQRTRPETAKSSRTRPETAKSSRTRPETAKPSRTPPPRPAWN